MLLLTTVLPAWLHSLKNKSSFLSSSIVLTWLGKFWDLVGDEGKDRDDSITWDVSSTKGISKLMLPLAIAGFTDKGLEKTAVEEGLEGLEIFGFVKAVGEDGREGGAMVLERENFRERSSQHLAIQSVAFIFLAHCLESLLIGHEDWVYSMKWQPPLSSSVEEFECHQPQNILSASMDKTMMIWQPKRTTGIWMNVVTVGELSRCALGFYGGHWCSSGDAILAHGYGGSFHIWRNVGVDVDNWKPQKVPSGHCAAVTDIA